MEEKPIINKICKICLKSGPDMKFEPRRHQCSICIAKKRNLFMKNKSDYFNNYYHNHRDKLLEQKKGYYKEKNKIKKSLEILEL